MFDFDAEKTLMRLDKYRKKGNMLDIFVPLQLVKSPGYITLMNQMLVETVSCTYWITNFFQCSGNYHEFNFRQNGVSLH